MARGLDLDLVEVAPMANPPVCRIMDYGKFRYEEAQKAKESRKKSTNVSVKEVKFKPKIGRGDFDVKVRRIDQFIHEGHKVKVTMQFRGREMAHPELGSKILDDVLAVVGEYVKVETQARLEGRNMSMVLAPDKKALEPPKPAKGDDVVDGQATGSDGQVTTADEPGDPPVVDETAVAAPAATPPTAAAEQE
jgi:translation initiation factor IF-3